jgi:DNA-directed RNA polymerase subunit M/transcription elongation factor TFIIS
MRLLKALLNETCPKCNRLLESKAHENSKNVVIKICPDLHYQKEFHPALETYIESEEIS